MGLLHGMIQIMRTRRLIIIAIMIFVISAAAAAVYYFLLSSQLMNRELPECRYGPTDAVLNEPCKQGEFHP